VSGTVFTVSDAWGDAYIEVRKDNNWVTSMDSETDGSYEMWLSPGTYEIYVNDGNEKVETIEVGEQNLTHDIKTGMVKVSGKVYTKDGQPFQDTFRIGTKDGETITTITSTYPSEDGSYSFYVPTNQTYLLYLWNAKNKAQSVSVGTTNVTADFYTDLVKVSGTIKEDKDTPLQYKTVQFDTNGSTNDEYTDYEGNYTVYLQPGKTYTISYKGKEIGSVTLGDVSVTKDIIINETTDLAFVDGKVQEKYLGLLGMK
jgi:hypothetical protein